MRIASLVPSSTEMLFELGLGDSIVAVTHECDYPPVAAELPHLTRSVIPEGLSAADIDSAVREQVSQGKALYELDEAALAELDPELIVTQAVCDVCAVSYDEVAAVAQRLPSRPAVLSLDPTTIGEMLADVPRLAEAAGVPDEGEQLVEVAAERIDDVRDAVGSADPVTVAALEWLDPVFVGGHWVPQMIELAGGIDVLGLGGEKSRTAEWAELEAVAPEVVVSMPCGYGTERAARETLEHGDRLAALGARVAAVDASSYFSRPGPRLVDGIELMAHLLHPGLVAEPPADRFTWLDLDRSGSPA
jgi:iron complex transport system substrate-binding protein